MEKSCIHPTGFGHFQSYTTPLINIMRKSLLLLALPVLALILASGCSSTSSCDAPDNVAKPAGHGWTSLFNGKDLTGWVERGGHAKYFVEDGCLVGEALGGNVTNSFLCTTKNYDNFILELDFKDDPMLNSGVQIRSEWYDHPTSVEWKGKTIKIPAGYVHGYQVEIDADVARKRLWSAGIYDERRRLWLYPGQLGGDKTEFSEQGAKIFIPNDWNHLRIEAVGDSIKTYLNGVLCANINDSMTPTGFIGLQVHHIGDKDFKPGVQIRFRNIYIKHVKPHAPEPEPTPNTLTDKEKADGWRLLWDGQTTDGWRSARAEDFPKESWAIKDGELSVVSSGNAESQEGGDIITKDRYSSFELLVDFKTTPGCNSGIKYFVQPDVHPVTGAGDRAAVGSAIGYEYQILDDARHPDAKLGRNGDRRLGALYDLLPVTGDKEVNPIGEWNTARIIVRGNHVQHWLNGKKILDYNRDTPEFKEAWAESKFKKIPEFPTWPDGHILLQEHGSKCSFRNVKIRIIAAE
jgi:hypothetical protein